MEQWIILRLRSTSLLSILCANFLFLHTRPNFQVQRIGGSSYGSIWVSDWNHRLDLSNFPSFGSANGGAQFDNREGQRRASGLEGVRFLG